MSRCRREAQQQARDWDSLQGLIDDPRFIAVQARFKQQIVDAKAFSEIIVGYYKTFLVTN